VPKEIIQVLGDGWNFEINNWQYCHGKGLRGINKGCGLFGKLDKGHSQALNSFVRAVESSQSSPIPLNEIIEVLPLGYSDAGDDKINFYEIYLCFRFRLYWSTTASIFASKGHKVTGVDVSPQVINIINSGKIHS
jgi:hypothetical protein